MMRILFHNHRNHRLRSLSIYALLTLFPLMANAQVGEYRTDLAIGVNGGYMMNRISFQPEVPQSNMGGMTGGLTIRYTCEKYFSSICAVTAEVNYGQMGWKENIFDIPSYLLQYYKHLFSLLKIIFKLPIFLILTIIPYITLTIPIIRFFTSVASIMSRYPYWPDWAGVGSVGVFRLSYKLDLSLALS